MVLIIPAASPYFLPGIPRTNDLTPHLMRTFFFGEAASYSGLWPRWSAELVYGHGYPVFNFFPSLFHAFTQLFHQLGLPLLTAYRVVVYLHFLIAAIGSYLLGKQIFQSRLAGWGAAVVYVYSPYLLYDAIVRGSGPETQALALLPFLILAIWQASDLTVNREQKASSPQPPAPNFQSLIWQSIRANLQAPKWIVLTAVFFALTFLSHPIAYLLLIPIGVWLLLKAGFAWQNGRFWHTLIGPAIGIGLGGFLVTFFWLPAFLEVQFTRADLSISQGYAYQENFLTLLNMISWPKMPADPALINPPVVRAIPLIGLLWAFVIIGWQWRHTTRNQREIVIAWAVVLLLSMWLITSSSQFVWDNFPLLRLIFYPWRLLSMTSVATAVLVAVSMQILVTQLKIANKKFAFGLVFVLTAIILISAMPWLFPPRQSMPEQIDTAKALSEEFPPFFIGTTTLGEFLPVQVSELPAVLSNDAELRAEQNPDRLQAIAGAHWTRLNESPIDAQYQISLDTAQELTYQQFYFPGWQVTLNGEAIPITPSKPDGLITFTLPAGEHQLQIKFGNSWPRTVGWVISGVTLIVLLALAYRALRQRHQEQDLAQDDPLLTDSLLLVFGVTAVLLWLFFSFVDTPLRRTTLQAESIYGQPLIKPVDFAGEVKLLSYEIPETAVSANSQIPLTLYLQAQRNIGVPYSIGLQVHDGNGLNWMADNTRPTDWRFIADEPWPLDAYRMEPYLLSLNDGTPPGTYQIHVGLVRTDTHETVASHNIATVAVDQPMQGDYPLEDGMMPAPETAVANGIQLLGTRLDRPELRPGDPIRITTLWQVQTENPGNQFTLQLLAPDDSVQVEQTIIIAPEYPIDQWQPTDRLRNETLLRLPAAITNGEHRWQLKWGEQLVDVGTITVNAPERSFAIPEMETAVNETFGDIATLLGINIDQANNQVMLIWQAQEETATSYRVFVHLVAPTGEILKQSDGEPVQWSRPTTGWITGEILQDGHHIEFQEELPTGTQLRIGLYDPATNQRLTTKTADSVTLSITD